MIKVFTKNKNSSKMITPRAGALQLVVNANDIEPWSTIPPGNFEGSVEIAHYESEKAMLDALGYKSMAEFREASRGFRVACRENIIIPGTIPPSDKVIKLTSFVTRKDPLTRADFMKHYPNNHAPLVKKTPELPRYVQNYTIDEGTNGDVEFDGVAELWWTSRDQAIRSWSSPEIQNEQSADCLVFLDAAKGFFLFGSERYVE